VDLYSPEYDFVYGEADVNAGVAALSTYRLISENPNSQSVNQMIIYLRRG
jgi:predicted Zn-dependent protease